VINDYEIEVIVEDADSAIPDLIELSRQDGLTVKTVEKRNPLFDDVFVRLIEARDDHE
jgi:hypothetical protein